MLKAACRGVLPDAIIDRRKGYFPVPALTQLEGPALALVREALDTEAARGRGALRADYVVRLLADPNEDLTTLEGSKLWQVGLLELWLQEHGL